MWPGEQPGYAKDVAAFEKLHPNISVTIEVIPYANYEPKLTEEFTTGGGPDVFWVNTPWVPTWAKDGVFENLTPLVKKSNINMSDYNSYLVSLYSRGSDIYALPKELNTVAFVYNKSYFAKEHLTPPTSWSWSPTNPGSFLHFLQEATTDTNGNNALSPKFNPNSIAVYGSDIANVDESGWGNFLAEDGSNVIGKPYATTVTLDTPAAVQTMSFINQLMYKYHVLVPGSELGGNAEANNGQDANLFAAGKIAMELSGSWNTESTVQQCKFAIGTIELPAGPVGVATVANGGADAVNPRSEPASGLGAGVLPGLCALPEGLGDLGHELAVFNLGPVAVHRLLAVPRHRHGRLHERRRPEGQRWLAGNLRYGPRPDGYGH